MGDFTDFMKNQIKNVVQDPEMAEKMVNKVGQVYRAARNSRMASEKGFLGK